MKRFRKLLAVINGGPGDENVTQRAIDLAKANKAQLMFCATHEMAPPVQGILIGSGAYRELDRLMRKEHQSNLDEAVAKARAVGQPARSRLLEGKAFLSIIREVLRDDRDLVLFPDDNVPSFRSRLFGSTATHLLRKCPCPVWVLKPTSVRSGQMRFRRVLAAVNAASRNPVEEALNIKILELATSLAKREGAEIHVVHCWSVFGESLLAGPRGPLTDEEIKDYRKQTRQRNHAAADALLARFLDEGHEIQKHILKGEPDTLIPEVSEKLAADVVVMGTVARTGLDGVLIGNTAENVLQQIGRSVLAVKPDGFVSPVRLDNSGP
jgi:nucleotide-binding universal stress UspA family protein